MIFVFLQYFTHFGTLVLASRSLYFLGTVRHRNYTRVGMHLIIGFSLRRITRTAAEFHKNSDLFTMFTSKQNCNPLSIDYVDGPQAAQAQNTRSYMVFFFLLICERSGKRDMGHILLPNNRIGSRET